MAAGGKTGPEVDVVVREPVPIARFALALDEQWPILRFLGFGFYYAWIWLCYNSTMLAGSTPSGDPSTGTVFAMYLASTTALSLMLILAAVFPRVSAQAVESRAGVMLFALLASASTAGVLLRAGHGASDPLFLVASVLTGIGTAWVALRLGAVYAKVSAREATMYISASMVLACLLYFLVMGLPGTSAGLAMALLPVFAALCTFVTPEGPVAQAERPQRVEALPKWFFLRLVLAVGVISAVVGVTRGFSTLTQSAGTLDEQGVVIVATSACVAGILYIVVSFMGGNSDIGRLYYPAIILVVIGISVMPIIGNGEFEGHFVNIAYVLFIMMVWCLCAHVSYMSGLSPVRVFGLGRGASALGTTLGWLLGSRLIELQGQGSSAIMATSLVMVFVLLVVSMLVFNDRVIGAVLREADRRASDDPEVARATKAAVARFEGVGGGKAGPVAPADSAGSADPVPHRGAFARRCISVCEEYKITQRERDVFFLLAKGRTIDLIAEELGVTSNTAKSHIRHIYAKMGVHSKQEFLDLIESADAASPDA